MIKEAYVSFEVARLLKEKGFNIALDSKTWLCCMYDENGNIKWGAYDKNWYFRVTHQMAMMWLRKKGIAIVPIVSSILDNESFLWDIKIVIAKTNETYRQGWVYEEYENAIDDALEYSLKNLI